MSVINDMLRDLEQRKAPERSTDMNALGASALMIEPERRFHKGHLFLLLAVLVSIGLGGILFFKAAPETLRDAQVVQTVPVLKPALEVKSEPAIKTQALNAEPNVSVAKTKKVVNTEIKNKQNKPIVEQPLPSEKVTKLSEPKVKAQPVATPQLGVKPKSITKAQPVVTSIVKPTIKSIVKPVVKLKPSISPVVLDQNNAELARKLFISGEPRKAYRTLYDFMEKHSRDQKSRTVLISHLLQAERVAEAGDVLISTDLNQHPELRALKARWYVANGETNMALHTLRAAQPRLENFPAYYALLASYYQRFGFFEKSAEIYAQLVQYDEASASWWAGLAIALDSSKQYAGAVNAYEKALQTPGLKTELIAYIENRLSLLKANF